MACPERRTSEGFLSPPKKKNRNTVKHDHQKNKIITPGMIRMIRKYPRLWNAVCHQPSWSLPSHKVIIMIKIIIAMVIISMMMIMMTMIMLIMLMMCSLLLPLLRSSSARVVVLSSLAHKVPPLLAQQDPTPPLLLAVLPFKMVPPALLAERVSLIIFPSARKNGLGRLALPYKGEISC